MLRHRSLYAIVVLLILMACSSTVWDDVPTSIKEFISSYWPGASVSDYDERNGNYYVTIKNGATLVFDANYQWTSINGNGVPIPLDTDFQRNAKDISVPGSPRADIRPHDSREQSAHNHTDILRLHTRIQQRDLRYQDDNPEAGVAIHRLYIRIIISQSLAKRMRERYSGNSTESTPAGRESVA